MSVQAGKKVINSQDILNHMFYWWKGAGTPTSLGADYSERKPDSALLVGLVYQFNNTAEQLKSLKTEAARIGHFRQLLTTWKAVCSTMAKQSEKSPESYPFYDPKLDALRAFALFYEQFMPEIYYILYKKNVFLGVKFTQSDRERLVVLEKEYMKGLLQQQRKQDARIFMSMFR